MKDIPKEGWAVITYNKDGSRKNIEIRPDELSCAKLCVSQLYLGYPAPTVWHDGERVEGY